MNFDEHRVALNVREPDGTCDQLWRRWGREYDCTAQAAEIVILDPGPGYAVMCREHFTRFDDSQGGRGYTHEPFTLERARALYEATPVGG